MFVGKFVKCNVDNILLIFNWEKRSTKKDAITYSLIQTLHLIEVAVPCDRNRDTVTEIWTNTIDVVTKTEIKTPFQKKGQTQQMQSQKQKQRHRRRKRDKQNINRDKHNKIGTNTT